MKAVIFTFVLVIAELVSKTGFAQPLQILYSVRPPYYIVEENGNFSGLVSGPVFETLKQAGIKSDWKVLSPKRQLEAIRQDLGPACSPGWFKKPEREEFAKFSVPVYRDRPQILVMRPADHRNLKHEKITALLADPKYRLGVKLGYSYGGFFDGLIKDLKPKTISTSQDLSGMAKMLQGKRFDYFITTPEEFQVLFSTDQRSRSDVVAAEFNDIPPGNHRYLMCSKSVPDNVLETFNRAFHKMNP
jgi:uncharacterized protein (TIGR02285 family)